MKDLNRWTRHPLTGVRIERLCYDDGNRPAEWRVDVPGKKTVFVCSDHVEQWATMRRAERHPLREW